MIVTIDEAKKWLKVDFEEDDEDIQDLINAAEIYLFNATGIKFDNTNPLAKLYCRVLVTEWYENRSLMEEYRTSGKVRFILQSILLQLQYC